MEERFEGMEEVQEAQEAQVRHGATVGDIPYILRANTYYWNPAVSAHARRASEERRRAEFEAWYEKVRHILEREGISVTFEYSESCRRVYKRVTVMRNGKRSTMTAVVNALRRAEQAQELPGGKK